MLADETELHPAVLLTVKLYVPAANPVMVVLVPVPVMVTAPGVLVKVQVPDAGNPFKTTAPVATAHVGCVIVPAAGAAGVAGCALITTLAEAMEVHPNELLTV